MKLPSLKVPKKSESRVIGLIIGLVAALIIALSYSEFARHKPVLSVLYDLITNLEYRTYDLRFRIRGPMAQKHISKDIVLLDYDNESEEWIPFPPDRVYYTDIVRALGKNGAGARSMFFDIFFFDKSGRKLDPDALEIFSMKFMELQEAIQKDTDETNGLNMRLKTKLSEAGAKLSGGAKADAARMLDEIVNDPEIIANLQQLSAVREFLDNNKDLHTLAPDRDQDLRNALSEAGNVYLAQVVEDLDVPPHSVREILIVPRVHEAFSTMIKRTNRTITKNQLELDINTSINNLTVHDYQTLEDAGRSGKYKGAKALKFNKEELAAIVAGKTLLQDQIKKALELNTRFGMNVPAGASASMQKLRKYYRSLKLIKPLYMELAQPAAGLGYVKPELSKDGIIRMAAPVAIFEDKMYPHIAILLAHDYLGVGKKDVKFYPNHIVFKNVVLPGGKKKGDISIPLYKRRNVLVNWAGNFTEPDQFTHRSFKRIYETAVKYNAIRKNERGQELTPKEQGILSGLSPKDTKEIKKEIEFFKGKIVITGLTADGTHDLNPIPFSPRYPLVGMHANLINTVLNRLFIRTPPGVVFALILLVFGAVMGWMGSTTKQLGALTALGLIAGYGLLCVLLFNFFRSWFPFVPVLFTVVFTYLVVLGYRFMTEGQEARRMKSMFATYVNPSVVDTLIANPEKLRLGGEKMELTAMFALAWGPGLDTDSAEILVERLNEYFTAMTEQIFKYDGTLDKYEGKIIMAIYGAPVHFDDHAAKACLSCAGMRKALEDLTEKWKQEGKEPIYTTVGLNSGPMIAGNMGSASRFNYTIMGDSVNLSARILGAARQYGVDYMISEVTYEQAREKVVCRLIDNIIVVGKNEPSRVYQVLAGTETPMPEKMVKLKEFYEKGLELYTQRKWDEAIASFNKVLEYYPDDEPSKVLMKRCGQYKDNPPADTWQGEFALTSKGL